MYKFDGNIVQDRPGSMVSKSPDPVFVADVLTSMYRQAGNLEDVYKLLMTEYNGENDFYALLADLSEKMDEIDLDALTEIRMAYATGIIYSKAERWIISALTTLYDNTNAESKKESIIDSIANMIDDCEYITVDSMQVYAAELYACIAAMYNELFNTYDMDKWIKARDEELPVLNDVTRGFNEFMVRMNMSINEIADVLYEKTQEFVYVTNEVDRDAEVSKKIRAMVPDSLRDEFENVIELFTPEDVEDMLNGRRRITAEYLVSIGEGDNASDDDDE